MCLDEYMTFKSMGSSNYATSHSNKILKLLLMAITKNRFRMALKILLKGFYAGLSLGNNVFYAISSGVGFLCYIAFAFSRWISLLFILLQFPNDIIHHIFQKYFFAALNYLFQSEN